MPNPVVDAVAHTVTVQSSHFCDWRGAINLGFTLVPPLATVKVGKSVTIEARYHMAGTPPQASPRRRRPPYLLNRYP